MAPRLALGSALTGTMRGEVELGFNASGQGEIAEIINGALPPNTYPGAGGVRTYTLMGNLWVDLPALGADASVTPYVGGGLGAALVDANMSYADFPTFSQVTDAIGGETTTYRLAPLVSHQVGVTMKIKLDWARRRGRRAQAHRHLSPQPRPA